ncbi:MAG: oxygenase MpaB family protein [Candidatus Limnocylindria bacterium]
MSDERLGEAAGLFGPGSVAWRIDREALLLAGGSCALLMQVAHPAVAAGVSEHSTYRTDPVGRLQRTLTSSFSVIFGTRSQAQRTLARINAIHAAVQGRIPDNGEPYSALDPHALLWVHATLVDTALRIYDRFVGALSDEEAEAYHRESAVVAQALAIPSALLPSTLLELRAWMAEMIGSRQVRVTPQARDIAARVLYPTRLPPRLAWDAAHLISFSTLPDPLRRQYGIAWSPARERGLDRLAGLTRRALPLLPAPLRYVPQARSAARRAAISRARPAGHAVKPRYG